MQIDPTYNPEGNELKAQIIEQRASLKHLRILLNEMDFGHKIAVAQFACNLIGSTQLPQLINLKPFREKFDGQLQAAITLMGSLPPDTLSEIAIEILEEPRDQNE
ncbi:hypothetical protein QUA70_12485 [Microcoleus sp. LAD1_D5]|uniref:hypothetical protein n=1 Tax=unclassified Microcoleus TaxID=2642155 RepID=UPI002FD77B6D